MACGWVGVYGEEREEVNVCLVRPSMTIPDEDVMAGVGCHVDG